MNNITVLNIAESSYLLGVFWAWSFKMYDFAV